MFPKRKGIFFQLALLAIFLCSSNNSALAAHPPVQQRILQSASEFDYPPFAIVRPDGTADGFSVELLKAVAEAVDLEVNISVGPWHEIKQQLTEGRLDVLPLVAYSPEREKIYDFTAPYLQMHGTIFVRKGDDKSIHSEADLKDKEVMVMRDDASHEYVVSQNIPAKLILTATFEEAMKLLSSGKHDAVLCQYLMGLQLIKKLNITNVVSVSTKEEASLKIQGVKVSGFEQKFCLAVPEGRKELLASLNEGLAIVSANGTYDQLYDKWFSPILPKPAVSLSTLLKYVFSILAPLLFIIAVVGIGYLRREVRNKTKSLRDEIQERQQAEEALLREKELIQKYLDVAGVLLVALNASGTIILINREGRSLLQTSEDEVLGRNWFDHYLPKRMVDEAKGVFSKLMSGDITSFEYYEHPIRTSTGEERIVAFRNTILFDEKKNISGILFSGEDVTERKQAEAEKERLQSQLRQATKMQAVGTMAGGIAHEFNNLLSVIMGCAEMARDEVPRNSFARAQLDNVMKASYRVKDLVKQILTFSRQGQQKKISLNLCSLVKESLKLIQTSIPSSVKIKENIDPACGSAVVDPTEIQQIIMNLCSNAVWAMKEKGTIEISQKEVVLTNHDELIPKGLPAGRYIKLTVSDTGCGIDQEALPRIFDPFFTTKEVGQGTGMGLSIIYAIMESYGGAITVESDPGNGVTFHLYFPATDEPAVEKPEQIEEVPKGSERILFVDDEEMYAEMGAEIISRLGYSVDLQMDSMNALEVFKIAPENYALVITDQIMPGLLGEELIKEIRSIRPDMPIILCTGYSSHIDEKKAYSLGINAFAYKPIVQKDMAKLIRKVLDKK